MSIPKPPTPPTLHNTERSLLVERVKDALQALPGYFESTTNIEGLDAQDLFAVSTVLGGAIEVQVVATLNRLRNVWDPEDYWGEYRFERFAQSFPDVQLLRRVDGATDVALGIELKGWYLLSKEMEPSFRYRVTSAACDPHDLLVIVPWHLMHVLTGTPIVHAPFVVSALYAAEQRNYYWQHLRATTSDTAIISPEDVGPYPPPKSNISDAAVADGGSNFGRVARSGLTDKWVKEMLNLHLSGIEVRHWVQFFTAYAETTDPDAIGRKVDSLIQSVMADRDAVSNQDAENAANRVRELVIELAELLRTTGDDT